MYIQTGLQVHLDSTYQITRDCAVGLTDMHCNGFVHRNLDLSNLLHAGGRVKIGGFGSVR